MCTRVHVSLYVYIKVAYVYHCTRAVQRTRTVQINTLKVLSYESTLKVLSYENTFESMTKVRAADLLEFFDPETRQFEPPKHGLNGRQ